MALAGKYANLMQNPVMSAGIGGALAAGSSALGNIGSDKPTERVLAEALGAGAVGAGVGGLVLPRVSQFAADRAQTAARNFTDVYRGVQSPMSAGDRRAANVRVKTAKSAMKDDSPAEVAETMANILRGKQYATNVGTAGLGLAGARTLGEAVGGASADLMGIDPENPGSSNTMGARYSMQGMPPM